MKSNVYLLIVFLMLFVNFEGFGFRSDSWGGLGTSNLLSIYSLLQFIVLSVTFYFAFGQLLKAKKMWTYFVHQLYTYFYIPLFFLYIIFFVIIIAFSIDNGYNDPINNIYSARYFLFFFAFWYISNNVEYEKIFKATGLASLISSISIFLLAFGLISPAVSEVRTSDFDLTRQFRIVTPVSSIVLFGYFYFLYSYLIKGNFKFILYSLICFSAILIQFNRTPIATAIIFSFILFIFLNPNTNFFYKRLCLLFVVILSLFGLFYINFSNQVEILSAQFNQTLVDLLDSDAKIDRLELVQNTISYVFNQGNLFGVGFFWREFDFAAYITNAFAERPTTDSSVANLLIVYGVFSLPILFTYLAYGILSFKRYRSSTHKPEDAHGFVYIFYICLLSNSFSTDVFLITPTALIFNMVLSYIAQDV